MRIVVTGAGGLLGATLVPRWREAGAEVIALGHADLDVTDGPAVTAAIAASQPRAVVHCAAWTDVDGAEREPEGAMRVNAGGTHHVAVACAAAGAALLHVSTDYVFDGSARTPIAPAATLSPLGVYARSKAAAEARVREAGGRWLILRTGWTYGPGRRNFVDTMRSAARAGRRVHVVDDQVGAPTSVRLVAEVLWALLKGDQTGVWHATAAGAASWFDVARAVFEAADADPANVHACSSAELGRAAPRPAYAVLDCGETERRVGAAMPGWREQVTRYVRHDDLAGLGLARAVA